MLYLFLQPKKTSDTSTTISVVSSSPKTTQDLGGHDDEVSLKGKVTTPTQTSLPPIPTPSTSPQPSDNQEQLSDKEDSVEEVLPTPKTPSLVPQKLVSRDKPSPDVNGTDEKNLIKRDESTRIWLGRMDRFIEENKDKIDMPDKSDLGTFGILKDHVEIWIGRMKDEEMKEHARNIIKKTKVIPFKDFKKQIKNVSSWFKTIIEEPKTKVINWIMCGKANKSGVWTSCLFYQDIRDTLYKAYDKGIVIRFLNPDIDNHMKKINLTKGKCSLNADGVVNVIVDDMAYSGKQLKVMSESIVLGSDKQENKKTSFYLLMPYIGTLAKKRWKKELSKMINFILPDTIESFESYNLQSSKLVKKFGLQTDCKVITPVCQEYKCADTVSTLMLGYMYSWLNITDEQDVDYKQVLPLIGYAKGLVAAEDGKKIWYTEKQQKEIANFLYTKVECMCDDSEEDRCDCFDEGNIFSHSPHDANNFIHASVPTYYKTITYTYLGEKIDRLNKCLLPQIEAIDNQKKNLSSLV